MAHHLSGTLTYFTASIRFILSILCGVRADSNHLQEEFFLFDQYLIIPSLLNIFLRISDESLMAYIAPHDCHKTDFIE
jgi:hypothetical protein